MMVRLDHQYHLDFSVLVIRAIFQYGSAVLGLVAAFFSCRRHLDALRESPVSVSPSPPVVMTSKSWTTGEGRAHNDDFDGVHSSDYTFRRHKVGEIGVILVYFDPNMGQTIVFYTPHDDLSFYHIMTGQPAVCSDASTIRSALPCDDPVVMSSSYAESETVD